MKIAINNNKSCSYIIFIFFFLVFYFPKVMGRDYIGLIFLYFIFMIIILTGKLKFPSLSLIILSYSIVIILFELLNQFENGSYVEIARAVVYSLIPFVAFSVGFILSKYCKYCKYSSIFKIIYIIGIIQALIGMLQLYSTTIMEFTLNNYSNYEKYIVGFQTWKIGRIIGTIGNPNTYGIFMAIFTIFLLIVNKEIYNKKHILILFSIFISVFAIIFSQSRAAYIVFAIGLYFVYIKNTNGLFKKMSYAVLFVIVLILILLYGNFITWRFTPESLFSLGNRMNTWKYYIDFEFLPFDIHSIIGHGDLYIRKIGKSIDNYYLNILIQQGILGIIYYIFLNLVIYNKIKYVTNTNVKKFLRISLIMILISDLTGAVNMNFKIVIPFYFLLGFSFSKGAVQ